MAFIKDVESQIFKPIIAVLLLLVVWLVPSSSYNFIGLDLIQQRVLLIFIVALICWVTEIIPAWVTSVTITTILLFSVSDSALKIFDVSADAGQVLSSKALIESFADPIIFLFIGGFILAAVASKFEIDRTIVNFVIRIIGTKSNRFLLGIMLVTAFCSMFISNTATAIMMLTLVTPMFKGMESGDKGKTALVLGISVAANLGGLGTPIGTPPNAIILKYLNNPNGLNMDIGFFDWMIVFLPLALILVLASWFLLIKLFPFKATNIKTVAVAIGDSKHYPLSMVVTVSIILGVTVALWCFDRLFGVNANVVAFVPICMFSLLGVITKKDLGEIDWSVLWLVAGGFALGLAFQDTGLAKKLISAIDFGSVTPFVIIISCWVISWALSNVISNTASATLVAPIFVALATSLSGELEALGGAKVLLLGVAIFTSLAMILPISTPPNALAYSTGFVDKKDMQKVGIIIGGLGFTLCISVIYIVSLLFH